MDAAPHTRAATPRFDDIDVLRGFSIVAVILLHSAIRLRGAGVGLDAGMPGWLYHLLFWNGNNGVTVFFAISGFLITTTSLRRWGSLRRVSPRGFYRIRFARIAPLLLLLLAVLSFLHLIHARGFYIAAEKASLARALFAALTFHLNWLEAMRGYLPANWDVLWSLSVEEMFYLFFPITCVVLLRLRRGWVMLLALLLILVVCGPFARTIWNSEGIQQEKSYLGGMDGIALGCLCALVTDREQRRGSPWLSRRSLLALQFAGAAMLALIAIWPHWTVLRWVGRTGLDSTILALGTCLIMFSSVRRNAIGTRWTAPLRWFGRHSYEVYLTHEFVVVWGTALYVATRVGPPLAWVVGILVVTAPVGALAAHYFSEPLNRKLRGSAPPPDNHPASPPSRASSIGSEPLSTSFIPPATR